MKELSTYLIGEVLGKLSTVVEVTPVTLDNASRKPIYGLGLIGMMAMRVGIPKDVNEFISVRLNDVDINDFDNAEILPPKLQGAFLIGFHNGQNPKCIKTLIEQTNLTHQEIADKIGVARNTVTRWSRGAVEPGINARYELEKLSFKFE